MCGHSPTVIASYLDSTAFISDRNSCMRGPLQYWYPANCHSLDVSVTGASGKTRPFLLGLSSCNSEFPATRKCRRCRRGSNLRVHVHSVYPKPVNTPGKPKLHCGLINGFPCHIVLPIKIWLLRAEQMEKVFLRQLIPLPGAATEVTTPVVWGLPFAIDIFGRAPYVPVTLRVAL